MDYNSFKKEVGLLGYCIVLGIMLIIMVVYPLLCPQFSTNFFPHVIFASLESSIKKSGFAVA